MVETGERCLKDGDVEGGELMWRRGVVCIGEVGRLKKGGYEPFREENPHVHVCDVTPKVVEAGSRFDSVNDMIRTENITYSI